MKNKKQDRETVTVSLSRRMHDRLLVFMKDSGLGKSNVIKMALHELFRKEIGEEINDEEKLNKDSDK